MNTLQKIYENKLVAVIRGATVDNIVPIGKALSAGGVKILEITAETPQFISVIERAAEELGEEEATVGAGTVLDPETARTAIMAGAKFIFSPTVNAETIKMTKRYGCVSIPGAMTPTEILTAYELGGDIIKVFPANIMGPRYLKDVHGPLPQIPLMPTGGVYLENMEEYFRNGAVAVGLGSSLVKQADLKSLTERAAQFVEKLQSIE